MGIKQTANYMVHIVYYHPNLNSNLPLTNHQYSISEANGIIFDTPCTLLQFLILLKN